MPKLAKIFLYWCTGLCAGHGKPGAKRKKKKKAMELSDYREVVDFVCTLAFISLNLFSSKNHGGTLIIFMELSPIIFMGKEDVRWSLCPPLQNEV